MKRKRLSSFPGGVLYQFGLLITFVLLMAANAFSSAHSVLASVLVFIFCLAYLFASVVAKRAEFLYGTMLLGAVSYFLACHGMGMPGTMFPLLSVPLVFVLFIASRYLSRLPDRLRLFPLTVIHGMNITVVVFAIWALIQVAGLMRQPGLMRYVAGLTFLGYAGIYLAHRIVGARAVYTYIFSLFLSLGGIFLVVGVWSVDFCWIPAMASAAGILLIGTKFHRDKKYGWSRHFYFSCAPVIFISLVFSLLQWPFLILDLAVGSLLLWAAYVWLADAVEDIGSATMAERVMAKCFFFCAMLLTVPIVPMIFAQPTNLYIALAAVIAAITFSWVAWQRLKQDTSAGDVYVFAAVMFTSAGLMGLARGLPALSGSLWLLAGPLVLLVCLGILCVRCQKTRDLAVIRTRLAGAAVFPAFFAWFIPLLQNELTMAIAGAATAAGLVVSLGTSLKERSYYYAVGPSTAGILVTGALLLGGQSMISWVACAVAAMAAGILFVWAKGRNKHITTGAANLAWLILSAAAIVIAGTVGTSNLLYCVTVVGVTSVLMAWRPNRAKGNVLELFVQGLAALTTIAMVVIAVIGPYIKLTPAVVGMCMLILSVAYWLMWILQRGAGAARIANGLFALASLLVIFDIFSAVDARLGAGAIVILVLFVLSATMCNRFSAMAHSSVVTGHLISAMLACTVLIQAWTLSASLLLLLAGVALVLFHAFMPRLRANIGFRMGAALWLSFVVLFSITFYANTPYWQHVHLVVFLSLVWLAVGYVLGRTKAKAWSMPLYIASAILTAFCCIISILAPAVEGSWYVFLLSGFVFASLFLIIRDDVFAYLITLSLALMAYDWVKLSTSIFTQKVFFYLIIGATVMATVFLLPHLKKLLVRMGTLPIFSIFTWRGYLLLLLVIIAFTFLLFCTYSIKITEHPKFCLSCHNMGDYYQSWQHSSHKEVACIKCHYEPGVKATVVGKMEGMIQLVKYVSHSYGNKPQGMISNKSCMRTGCHEDIVNSGEVLLFHDKIRFRHDKHLNEQPQGKVLNCVSCHGQIVQGTHISINKTTCLTCHFYGRGDKQVAVGNCKTCHMVPKEPLTFVEQPFSHQEFLAGNENIKCVHCHSQVTQGSGTVSSSRCRSCHLEQLDEIEDQAQFHLIHVSEGHFDCLNCHDQIRHGTIPMSQQLLSSNNCTTCHGDVRHSIQERIYAGTALPELETTPDVMYEAGVACDGCHTDTQLDKIGEMTFTSRVSGAKQCTDCHNSSSYGEMLISWQEVTKETISELQVPLEKLEKALESSQAPAEQLAKARKMLVSVRTKLEYVIKDGSYGVHNIGYVSEILDNASEELESCQLLVEGWNKAAVQESVE